MHLLFLIALLSLAQAQPYPGKGPFLFNLKHQAFPSSGKPGALLYVPTHYQPTGEFDVVVFIHGFHNCIQNCVRDLGKAISCTSGQPARSTYGIISQLEKSQVRGILLAVEVAYDQASSNPGIFTQEGTWKDFIVEFLSASKPHIGDRTLAQIRRLVIFSHSGAYQITGAIGTQKSSADTKLRQIVLLDSLYGSFNNFDTFISSHVNVIGNSSSQYQYTNVWTDHGGTNVNSMQQAIRIEKLMKTNNKFAQFFWDNTTSTLPPTIYTKYPIIFKHSALTHDQVPTYYFQQLLNGWK